MSALSDVLQERQRQDEQWGEQNHDPIYWLAVAGEELGEAQKAALDHDLANYRDEMVQLAAVAIAAVESFDREAK